MSQFPNRMICWPKIANYIYLWLMGQSIGTWINCQNVSAYIKFCLPFFHITLWSHTSLKLKLEAKYAFFYLALHWTCLTFESCLRFLVFCCWCFFFKFVWFRYSCTWFNRSENKQREIKKNLLQQQIQSLL